MLSVLVNGWDEGETYIFTPVPKRLKVIMSFQDLARNTIS